MTSLTSDTLAGLYLKQGHTSEALSQLQVVQGQNPSHERAQLIDKLDSYLSNPRLRRLEELLARIRQARER